MVTFHLFYLDNNSNFTCFPKCYYPVFDSCRCVTRPGPSIFVLTPHSHCNQAIQQLSSTQCKSSREKYVSTELQAQRLSECWTFNCRIMGKSGITLLNIIFETYFNIYKKTETSTGYHQLIPSELRSKSLLIQYISIFLRKPFFFISSVFFRRTFLQWIWSFTVLAPVRRAG